MEGVRRQLDTPRASPLVAGGARRFLDEARAHERAGRMTQAAEAYEAVIRQADHREEARVLAEAMRRLGGMRRRQHDFAGAIELANQSYDVAIAAGDNVLAAEAINGLALVHLERGEWDEARSHLRRALSLGAEHDQLRARIEQNLGVMANIQGDFRAALQHYQRSLEAFRAAHDESGCAIAYHNLGMISADQQQWDDADGYFRQSLDVAEATGDVQLRGSVLLNQTEVHLARQRYEDARQSIGEALRIFDQLGSRDGKSAAYKFLGMLYRETGSATLAEERLRAAMELADGVGARVAEAEATRELAVLYQRLGRNLDALKYLNNAHRLFRRMDARADLSDIDAKIERLEGIYLEVVQGWGRSIESTDSYTYGHSERVARYGAVVAAAMGLDDGECTTVRMGAHLHDLGKVRVPHEILNKPGRLTREEMEVMQMHPIYGIELLASVEFPWDIKPIIRWHHEKIDGSGYPDRLAGDEIPRSAQLICIVDVYDALTTTRSYRPAMAREEALAEMRKVRRWWRDDVFEGFMASIGR